jgi:hypothetical protein
MDPATLAAIAEAVAAYVADQYAAREEGRQFARLETRIVAEIRAAKKEILEEIRRVNNDRIYFAAMAVIDVFETYDRVGQEFRKLHDIISFGGTQARNEIRALIDNCAPSSDQFFKYFVPWILLVSCRAFAFTELTILKKAEDFDDALLEFGDIRDYSERALSGLRILNDDKFSHGVFNRVGTVPGEDSSGVVGYYYLNVFQEVAYFKAKPWNNGQYMAAREAARKKLSEEREKLFEDSQVRKTIVGIRDNACKHVECP